MLEVLQEATDHYGPALPLAKKIGGGHVPDKLLEAIPELWAQRRSQIALPAHTDGYHPYIPDPFRSRAFAAPGRSFMLDFVSLEENAQDLRAVGHHLLYADSLALSDPIAEIFDERYFSTGEPVDQLLSYRRTRLASLARFLVQVDPLIEDQVLVFIDTPHYDISYTAADLRTLAFKRAIRDAVTNLDPEGKELAARGGEARLGLPEGSMPFQPSTYAAFTLNGLLAELASGTAERGGWDLYLPQPAMQEVLGHLITKAYATVKPPSFDQQQHYRFLRDLLSVQLPNITERITPGDLVAIRRDGEAFETWRHDLSAALRVLDDNLTAQPDLPPAKQLKIIRDDLRSAAEHASAEVGRSKALSELRGVSFHFTVGAVVEAAFLHFEALYTALPATAALALVLNFLHGRPSAPTRKALARHYGVFQR